MKTVKQMKAQALACEKRTKVKGMITRCFGKLRANFGFTYTD